MTNVRNLAIVKFLTRYINKRGINIKFDIKPGSDETFIVTGPNGLTKELLSAHQEFLLSRNLDIESLESFAERHILMYNQTMS